MKRISTILLLSLFSITAFTSCIKDDIEVFDWEEQYEKEEPIIADYVAANMPGAVFHPSSGIWYEILVEGTEESYTYHISAATNSLVIPNITVQYEGQLLDGTVFDSNDKPEGFTFWLNQVIPAWQVAFLPQEINGQRLNGLTPNGLQKGSQIKIVTPSYLGYENRQNGNIPANSPLVFTITVLDIK